MQNVRSNILFCGILLLLCVDGWSCSPVSAEPPETYSISTEFSAAERAVIHDAVSAWCDATSWCPTEVEFAELGLIQLVDDIDESEFDMPPCPVGKDCSVSAFND